MNATHSRRAINVLLASGLLASAFPAVLPARRASAAEAVTPQDAQKIGVDAYIYGYALITSDVTRAAFINVKAPDPRTFQAPLNQFVSLPKYPPADYHGVTAPNADTLYSGAFLDVSKEPIVLSYRTCTAGTSCFRSTPSGPT